MLFSVYAGKGGVKMFIVSVKEDEREIVCDPTSYYKKILFDASPKGFFGDLNANDDSQILVMNCSQENLKNAESVQAYAITDHIYMQNGAEAEISVFRAAKDVYVVEITDGAVFFENDGKMIKVDNLGKSYEVGNKEIFKIVLESWFERSVATYLRYPDNKRYTAEYKQILNNIGVVFEIKCASGCMRTKPITHFDLSNGSVKIVKYVQIQGILSDSNDEDDDDFVLNIGGAYVDGELVTFDDEDDSDDDSLYVKCLDINENYD
jgi:hypothetical protein